MAYPDLVDHAANTRAARAAAIESEDMVLACILRSLDQVNEVRGFLETADFGPRPLDAGHRTRRPW